MSLFAISFIVGCSSSGKKQSPETKPAETTPAVVQTPAAQAPVSTEVSKSKTSKVKKESSTPSAAAEVTCTSGQDVRKLSIKGKGEGCELEYTKSGQANAIASQIIGNAKCEEVSSRIQEKLIAADFKCE